MNDIQASWQLVATDLNLSPAVPTTEAEVLQHISAVVNDWLQHDMHALIHCLYRLDVDEHELRRLLASQQQQPSADIIASTIWQRYQRIRATRAAFKPPPPDPNDDEEKW